MKFKYIFEEEDFKKVYDIIKQQEKSDLVRKRKECNVNGFQIEVSKEKLWLDMLRCLLTTQQKSSKGSPINKFMVEQCNNVKLEKCLNEINSIEEYFVELLKNFGGIRRYNIIAKDLQKNLQQLEQSEWEVLNIFNVSTTLDDERILVDHVSSFRGFGPKQSRNLIQMLGFSKYLIPLDSRWIKWIKGNNIFPFEINGFLSTEGSYRFLEDILNELCNKIDAYPCILDAAIFESQD